MLRFNCAEKKRFFFFFLNKDMFSFPEKWTSKFSLYSMRQMFVPFLTLWVIILNILAV